MSNFIENFKSIFAKVVINTSLVICISFSSLSYGGVLPDVEIIPQPLSVKSFSGGFVLSAATGVISNAGNKNESKQLQSYFEKDLGLSLSSKSERNNNIRLIVEPHLRDSLGLEGYLLTVNRVEVRITGATNTGVFYGIQTLRQLVKKREIRKNEYFISSVEIVDKPRFKWRSFLLDEARYFKGKEVVMNLLNEMSLLKMNVFHWHLTDDQGWRIEIKKYPLLTKKGAKRDSTQIKGFGSSFFDGVPHEGHYSQKEIREIVDHAAKLHIQIVPEIEMPGHASAAIAAYPWLSSSDLPVKEVPTTFGVHYSVFNVASQRTIKFLHDVLNEICELFPSEVIHIGGDEVKYDNWKDSPEIINFIKSKRLSSAADLQIWFTNGISNFLDSKGKRMMGWNDILGHKLHTYNDSSDNLTTNKLAPTTIVHFWKGDENLIRNALLDGYDVVNSYHVFTYLDYSYETIPIEKAYNFEPMPRDIPSNYQKQLIGIGCQMWGEWIPTVADMYQMVFPRIGAYAEVGWTKHSNKNYGRFERALGYYYNRWNMIGVNYYKKM